MTSEHPAADALRAAGFGPEDNALQAQADEARADLVRMAQERTQRLRELRQWHMTQVHKATANRNKAASGELAERYRKEWALHMGAVQTLNYYFPAGDYAQ
jgi:hypothetical protein